ncbi:MAG: recombination protein O N-terminal domain-containing protein [Paludibacteraceae bacterium]|nr:recombination protein O N-terminal domain-containing protein [Paludibacteraceae bacterium]
MSATTDAIVLSLQPHSDKAFVVHAYTRAGGRINYMVYGLGRKNAAGLYTPLSLLQITTDKTSIRTAQLSFVPTSITTDPYKRTVALFLSEVLYHILRHPMQDEPMFDFIAEAVQALDQTEEPQNFHLQFLIGLAAKLGFGMVSEPAMPTTRKDRQEALRELCAYFAEHVDTWKEPKSLDILMEVFD